jgi:hypothetical protein
VAEMVMYSGDEKGQKRKYPKITASSAQNEQISCKKCSFSLLLLTNPLSYTIRHNISMEVVAIGVLLSLTLGRQQVIIMVIFFFVKHDVMRTKITSISNFKPLLFLFHHGKAIFLVATEPSCIFPSFQSSSFIRVHQGRL